jgi:hypothetical protein
MAHWYAPLAAGFVILCQNPTAKYHGRKNNVPHIMLVRISVTTMVIIKIDQWNIFGGSSLDSYSERISKKRG